MYKLLLCWRYLRTRYIALASIISVTLGVATMIVVNSVMAGFSREMQDRIHGILSDMVFESHSLNGFHDPRVAHGADPPRRRRRHRRHDAHGHRAGHAQLSCRRQWVTRQVNLIGIDEETHAQVSDFGNYLQHPANREQLSFRAARGRLRPARSSGRIGWPQALANGVCRLAAPAHHGRKTKGLRAEHAASAADGRSVCRSARRRRCADATPGRRA